MQHLHLEWLRTQTQSCTFAQIYSLAEQLEPPKSNLRAVYFNSDVDFETLKRAFAAWIRGYALVPISKNLSEQIKNRLIEHSKSIPLDSLLQVPNQKATIEFDENRIACYIQTSGSTALPKIVALKNKHILSAAKTTSFWLKPESNETWLLNLPLHHIGGLSILFRSWLNCFQVFWAQNETLNHTKRYIENGDVQFVSLVPTQLKRLVESGCLPHSKFKKVLLGGGPCSTNVLQSALNSGFTVINSFGMTESAAQFTGFEYKPGDKVGSVHVGLPTPENAFKITSEFAPFVEQSAGLLWLRGEQIVMNYVSGEAIKTENNWFCTDDFAQLNLDGYIEIQMRRNDRIISGGENINPIEIESVLHLINGIEDAIVVGIPDDEWGQKVVALIQLNQNVSFDEATVKKELKKSLPSYKIPKLFCVVDEIPRISISKPNRKKALELAIVLVK